MPPSFFRLASLGAVLLLSTTARAQDIDRERFNPILRSIVKVEAVTATGGYSLGSAVAVAAGRFVTSCHVTAKAVSISVQYEGLRWPVNGQRADLERDLCVLDIPRLADAPVVRRRPARQLAVGAGVVAIGYTFGTGLSTQRGTVRALHAVRDGTVIQSATYFNSGASGGGLFTLDGELVGILTFRLKGAEAFYFSIPSEWIDTALSASGDAAAIAPLEGPAPFWSQPVERLPYFMRAATLQARQQWSELLPITDAWAAAEPTNAEPWFVRGDALAQLGRTDDATAALEKSAALDPAQTIVWQRLGELALQARRFDAFDRIIERLTPLDAALAAELRSRRPITTSP